MNQVYDAQYFIDKFEAIPEENWNANGFYVNKDNPECKCALGHLGYVDTKINKNEQGSALISLLRQSEFNLWVTDVNDGGDKRYQQETPKQRVLAALRDVKEKGQADG